MVPKYGSNLDPDSQYSLNLSLSDVRQASCLKKKTRLISTEYRAKLDAAPVFCPLTTEFDLHSAERICNVNISANTQQGGSGASWGGGFVNKREVVAGLQIL